MFQIKFVGTINTRILCSTALLFIYLFFFFRKSWTLWDNVKKWARARQATDDNTVRRTRFVFWVVKVLFLHVPQT